jgi:hypothetical protein
MWGICPVLDALGLGLLGKLFAKRGPIHPIMLPEKAATIYRGVMHNHFIGKIDSMTP